MKALLSTAIYRKITLLEFLDNFSTWCPTKDVTNFLDCSAKTLLSDIDYINEFWGGVCLCRVFKVSRSPLKQFSLQ
ncbi:helix-turn-helix domain-containing protein [Enterococcus pallens]|uniref:helix-turn-helix domain-containing protein n=1 Tax=Enterococcus pallens TaxID=160454 RepID=UPI001FE18E2F|nr:helix-turn-helix domain-containing protein [Enterococcus pallens]